MLFMDNWVLAAFILLAAGNHSAQSSPVSLTRPAMPSSVVITVGAETYVNSNDPRSIYGSSTRWYMDESPLVKGLLKFTVSGLNGLTPQQVCLYVYANSGSSPGIKAYAISEYTWAENTVTWKTAPAISTLPSSTGEITAGTWPTIDVIAFVTGEGTFSLGASTPKSTNISFAARESGVHAPYLVLQLPRSKNWFV